MADKRTKSIAKTISYIITHYIIQFFAVLWFTNNLALALSIIGLELVIETVYYYCHERAWNYFSKKIAKRKHKHPIIDELA
jgi:uncharacterized membrane protein